MNYFWLCQMAWMVCEALVMYRALVSAVMNSHIHKYMLKFNLACWGKFRLLQPFFKIIFLPTFVLSCTANIFIQNFRSASDFPYNRCFLGWF